MLDAYIYEGLRTPFGRHGGSLAKVRPDDLLAEVMKSVMAKSKFKIEQVEDIIVGCANQSGEDSRCVARHAGLSAGFPIEIPGTVLQRNCASGLGALAHAAHSITAGEGDVFIVAGVESMSRSPIVMSRAESAFDRGIKMFDSTIGPRFSNMVTYKKLSMIYIINNLLSWLRLALVTLLFHLPVCNIEKRIRQSVGSPK